MPSTWDLKVWNDFKAHLIPLYLNTNFIHLQSSRDAPWHCFYTLVSSCAVICIIWDSGECTLSKTCNVSLRPSMWIAYSFLEYSTYDIHWQVLVSHHFLEFCIVRHLIDDLTKFYPIVPFGSPHLFIYIPWVPLSTDLSFLYIYLNCKVCKRFSSGSLAHYCTNRHVFCLLCDLRIGL